MADLRGFHRRPIGGAAKLWLAMHSGIIRNRRAVVEA